MLGFHCLGGTSLDDDDDCSSLTGYPVQHWLLPSDIPYATPAPRVP